MYRALAAVLLAALTLLVVPLISLNSADQLGATQLGAAEVAEDSGLPEVTPANSGAVATVAPAGDSGLLQPPAGKSGGDPRAVPRDLPDTEPAASADAPPRVEPWQLVPVEASVRLDPADLAPPANGRDPPPAADARPHHPGPAPR